MIRLPYMRTLIRRSLIVALSSVAFGNALASSITSETLISSCKELIAIYDKKGERRFLAGMSTSVAEAMRAGICRGMIEEHANHDRCLGSWYTVAKNIAEMKSNSGVEVIMEKACAN